MDINRAVAAVEKLAKTFTSSGVTASEVQVRPSGDDVDVIKVWADLGSAKVDTAAWAKALETALAGVPEAKGFKLAVRAEAG